MDLAVLPTAYRKEYFYADAASVRFLLRYLPGSIRPPVLARPSELGRLRGLLSLRPLPAFSGAGLANQEAN